MPVQGVPFVSSGQGVPGVLGKVQINFDDLASQAGASYALALQSVSGVVPTPAGATGNWYATDYISALPVGDDPPAIDLIQTTPDPFNLPKSFILFPPKVYIVFVGDAGSGWSPTQTYAATCRGLLIPQWEVNTGEAARA